MDNIEEKDFPEIYQNADAVSKRAQARYLLFTKLQLWLLVVTAVVVLLSENIQVINDVQNYAQVAAGFIVVLLIASVGVAILLQHKDYQSTWYKSRALAESIKTMSWRFMMQADPYGKAIDKKVLLDDFRQLLSQHSTFASERGITAPPSASPGITETMNSIRLGSVENRKNAYIKYRIDDQRNWYIKKAGINKAAEGGWFWSLVGLQAIAIVLAIAKVADPELKWLPIDVFLVAAGAALSWIQVKKFRELSAAYTLTAQDIGLLKTGLEEVNSDMDLSHYVMDAENAFSREHTQWIARKDH